MTLQNWQVHHKALLAAAVSWISWIITLYSEQLFLLRSQTWQAKLVFNGGIVLTIASYLLMIVLIIRARKLLYIFWIIAIPLVLYTTLLLYLLIYPS